MLVSFSISGRRTCVAPTVGGGRGVEAERSQARPSERALTFNILTVTSQHHRALTLQHHSPLGYCFPLNHTPTHGSVNWQVLLLMLCYKGLCRDVHVLSRGGEGNVATLTFSAGESTQKPYSSYANISHTNPPPQLQQKQTLPYAM